MAKSGPFMFMLDTPMLRHRSARLGGDHYT